MTPTALLMMYLTSKSDGSQDLMMYLAHDGSQNLMRQEVVMASAGRRRRRSSPLGIDFGGDRHKTESGNILIRPEFVKSEACTTKKCEDCADKTGSGCWNGASAGVYDWVQVHVNANDPKDHYVLEVFAACSSSSTTGSWMVYPKEIVNADVKVYLDGLLKKSLRDADSNCASNCEDKYGAAVGSKLGYGWAGSAVSLAIAPGQKARIRIVLTPKTSGSPARAKLGIMGRNFDDGVEKCMSTKECLAALGDGSPESFELRNSNPKQRDCLSGASESSTCTQWKVCLPDDQEKKLLAFLRASLRAPALEEVGVVTRNLKTNEVACLDPSSADPESWECECVDMIVEKCGSADDETCMFNTMCAHADVCAEWKTASNCPTGLEQNAAATKRSSHVSTHSANISLLDTGLDNTLQGKCSQ